MAALWDKFYIGFPQCIGPRRPCQSLQYYHVERQWRADANCGYQRKIYWRWWMEWRLLRNHILNQTLRWMSSVRDTVVAIRESKIHSGGILRLPCWHLVDVTCHRVVAAESKAITRPDSKGMTHLDRGDSRSRMETNGSRQSSLIWLCSTCSTSGCVFVCADLSGIETSRLKTWAF